MKHKWKLELFDLWMLTTSLGRPAGLFFLCWLAEQAAQRLYKAASWSESGRDRSGTCKFLKEDAEPCWITPLKTSIFDLLFLPRMTQIMTLLL